MANLGLYYHGKGLPQDYAMALAWYEKAVEKGDPAGMFNLASMFDRGDGVTRSPQTAARHLLAAARGGITRARGDMDGDMLRRTHDTRRAVQELLAASGDYRGAIDGLWGPASRDAAKAYYMRRS